MSNDVGMSTSKRERLRWAGMAVAMGCAATAFAHHSYAMFDGGHVRTLQGVVDSVDWTNPHVSFRLRVTPESGTAAQTWKVESHSPSILQHYDWTAKSLRKGMQISVDCYPLRDGQPECRLLTVVLDTGQKLETKLSQTPAEEREFK